MLFLTRMAPANEQRKRSQKNISWTPLLTRSSPFIILKPPSNNRLYISYHIITTNLLTTCPFKGTSTRHWTPPVDPPAPWRLGASLSPARRCASATKARRTASLMQNFRTICPSNGHVLKADELVKIDGLIFWWWGRGVEFGEFRSKNDWHPKRIYDASSSAQA